MRIRIYICACTNIREFDVGALPIYPDERDIWVYVYKRETTACLFIVRGGSDGEGTDGGNGIVTKDDDDETRDGDDNRGTRTDIRAACRLVCFAPYVVFSSSIKRRNKARPFLATPHPRNASPRFPDRLQMVLIRNVRSVRSIVRRRNIR